MSGPSHHDPVASATDPQLARAIEEGFGRLSDWLELMRAHETHRRGQRVETARRWRDHWASMVMVVLTAAAVAVSLAIASHAG